MVKNKKILATLASIVAQTIFGFSFMFSKIAMDYVSPFELIAVRYAVAFFGLSIVVIISRQKLRFGKNILLLLLMSLFQPVLYFVFESYGILMTTSSFSSVMISLIPVVSMLCGIVVLKEYPSFWQYVFTVLSVAGVFIMASEGKSDGAVTTLGFVLLLGAVLTAVGYNVLSRKISAEYTPLERTYAMAIIGFVTFMSMALINDVSCMSRMAKAFANVHFTFGVIYLGLVSSVIAFLLLNYANTHLPVAKTTAFSNLSTVVAVIAGAVFLKERFTVVSAISTAMIIVGVSAVQLLGVKNKK